MACTGGILGETWEFKNGTWTDLTPTLTRSPSARVLPGFVYDSAAGYDVLFGSTSPSDTWVFSNGSWSQLTPATLPPARYNPAMTYDVVDREVVMYGGQLALGDSWVFKGGNWRNITRGPVSPPGGLDEAVMTWDAKDGYVLLFGGARSGTAASADTWSFIHGTWTNMTHSIAPPARYGGVLAYDAYAGYVVLFGGQSPSSPYILGDDSIYVGGTWS